MGSPTSSASRRCPTRSTRGPASATSSRSSSRAAPTSSPAARGRVIKSLGDSVLFVNDDPIAAYDIAEGIIDVIGRDPRMPDVRVGLASGVGGDAARRRVRAAGQHGRAADRASPAATGSSSTQATADLLPDDQFETRRLPARPVRGFGLVEPRRRTSPLTERPASATVVNRIGQVSRFSRDVSRIDSYRLPCAHRAGRRARPGHPPGRGGAAGRSCCPARSSTCSTR